MHDTNTGDDVSIRYSVWQLGYGMWPWTGLVPAGLIWWARTRWQQQGRVLSVQEEREREEDAGEEPGRRARGRPG